MISNIFRMTETNYSVILRGGNVPDVNTKTHLLFQYGYNVGCLWNIFWIISDEDLKNRNFDKAVFSFDLD